MAQFFVYLITSPNINWFSKFFHCQNQKTICNETVTTDPTTPQMCHYTTSWNIRWRTQACNATDRLRDQRWSSLACGPPNNPDLNPVDYAVRDALQQMAYQCWQFTTVNQLKKPLSLSGAKCRSVCLISLLVSGVAGFDASSSSKADILKIWREKCELWFFRQ